MYIIFAKSILIKCMKCHLFEEFSTAYLQTSVNLSKTLQWDFNLSNPPDYQYFAPLAKKGRTNLPSIYQTSWILKPISIFLEIWKIGIPLYIFNWQNGNDERLRVCSFGVIRIRISDLRSHGSWCIKGTDEFILVMDSSVPLMNYDPSDLWSLILILITLTKRTHSWTQT